MSNNFLGLSKNQTDGILNLLQLSLLGNNAGVNVNAATPPTSNITNLSGSIVPNSNNVMTAAKAANFYPQSVGATSSGIGVNNITGGVLTQQPIISQAVNDIHFVLSVLFLVLNFFNHFIFCVFFIVIAHI